MKAEPHVVPTSVLPNWERESEKFVPHLKRLIIYGTRREGMFRKDNKLIKAGKRTVRNFTVKYNGILSFPARIC